MKAKRIFEIAAVLALVASYAYAQSTKYPPSGGGGGSGTVTSITAGGGLSGGTITTSGTISLSTPVSVANGGTNATTASAARTSLSAAQSGANLDITSLGHVAKLFPASNSTTAIQVTKADGTTAITTVDSTNSRMGIGSTTPAHTLDVGGDIGVTTSGIFFNDGTTPTPNAITLAAPATVSGGGYSLTLPSAGPGTNQALVGDGVGGSSWQGPFATQTFVTNGITSNVDFIVAKQNMQLVCDTNQNIAGGGETTCDGQTTFLTDVLLCGQTTATENGLYATGTAPWTRIGNMPDNTSSAFGAIVGVAGGGGTTYDNSLWFLKNDGSGTITCERIGVTPGLAKPYTSTGSCSVSSTTLSTTPANLTCTGVPASTAVAVTCSGGAAMSTPAGDAVYCRATGTVDQIACNTVVPNTTAMTFACQWTRP